MSKSQQSDLPPPPPYEEIESGRVEAEPGDENENTPLIRRIAPTRSRIWGILKAILIGWTLVLILAAAVKIIGGKGDEVWKKRVVIVGQWIFYLGVWFFSARFFINMAEEERRGV
jgi:hypothetical protein